MSSAEPRVIVDGMHHRTTAASRPISKSIIRSDPSAPKMHVALILDGNGRWATSRGLPRSAGHQQGTRTVRQCVRAAPALDIGTLTLYAFSSDNWQRPASEVSFLMRLLDGFIRREAAQFGKHGIRVSVIGRRDRLPPVLIEGI